jgi:riboflavin kinase
MSETQPALGSAEVTTLKHLALIGGLEGEQKLSCATLADRLDASTQTASRRLQRLEDNDCLTREIVSDGQWIEITETGEQFLQAEYASYRRIFERDVAVALYGTITSGFGGNRSATDGNSSRCTRWFSDGACLNEMSDSAEQSRIS